MAAIKKGYGRGTLNTDALPATDTVLRDIATDLAAIKAALTTTAIATANATDLGTSEALANAIKTAFNGLQTALAAVTLLTTAP